MPETVSVACTLGRFYHEADSMTDHSVEDPAVRQINASQRLLARSLVTVGYTRDGRFRQDPARSIPAIPDLAPAMELGNVPAGSDRYHVLRTHLTRGQNRLVWSLRQAERRIAERIQ